MCFCCRTPLAEEVDISYGLLFKRSQPFITCCLSRYNDDDHDDDDDDDDDGDDDDDEDVRWRRLL